MVCHVLFASAFVLINFVSDHQHNFYINVLAVFIVQSQLVNSLLWDYLSDCVKLLLSNSHLCSGLPHTLP